MDKVERNFEIYDDQLQVLEEVAEKYDLPDVDKALRVLLDYVIEEADRDEIFAKVRCLRC
ncbi:MAG: hypothetical protein ACNYPG_04730 [Candidatus Porifericomitaceae bacterium WSBS_2022_MAG_OTU9]